MGQRFARGAALGERGTMDFTNILITAVVALGLFSADAVINSDNINVEINMPRGYGASEISVGNQIAENLFLNEIEDIVDTPTFVRKPDVRSTGDDTVVSLVSDLMGLGDLTFVIQRAFGLDPIILSGSVIKRDDRFYFVVVANVDARHRMVPMEVSVAQAQDEPITALIRRGAAETMLVYEQYLTTLYFLGRASNGSLDLYQPSLPENGWAGVDALIQKNLVALPNDPQDVFYSAEIAERRAMYINLHGMVALAQEKIERAAAYFQEATAAAPSFAPALLNLAFTRVHQDRYQEASDLVKQVLDHGLTTDPIMLAATHITGGVAAWGLGKLGVAEQHFQRAIDAHPRSTMAHVYWGELLAHTGDARAAGNHFAKARANLAYFEAYAELAMLDFRLSPEDNAPLRRIARQ